MKSRNLLESFNHAFEGVVYALKTQRNMRIHFAATAAVLCASLILKLSKVEILILFMTIAFVIVAEMLNTAVEVVVDMFTLDPHPLAALAKNLAAGAVLIASVLAVIVGYLIFFPAIDAGVPRVIVTLQQAPAHLTLIAIVLTIVLVIAGKAITKRGTPVQGGMPSGHTALSAAAATVIGFVSKNSLLAVLALFLVVMVAESRIENEVHSWGEVLVGGLLGFLLTLLIFQVMV